MKIIFICTANTCRSVLAHYYALRRAGELNLPLDISSAGLEETDALRPPDEVIKLLGTHGTAAVNRAPVMLTADLAAGADVLLAMTRAHTEEIKRRFPAAASKTRLLAQYAGLGNGDVADPYGGGEAVYRAAFKLIISAVNSALEKLAKKVKY